MNSNQVIKFGQAVTSRRQREIARARARQADTRRASAHRNGYAGPLTRAEASQQALAKLATAS